MNTQPTPLDDRRRGIPRGPSARAITHSSADRVTEAVDCVKHGIQPLDVINRMKLTQPEQREFLRRVELARRLTL